MKIKFIIAVCALSTMIAVGASAAITPPPLPLPTDTDQCKDGGWETFTGTYEEWLFKNQGDCVSFVSTDGRNEPAGTLVP